MNRTSLNLQAGKRLRTAGFSLVEVTLALGLVAYSLVALIGLFAVGLSASRSSTTETALSQIVRHVSSTYDGSLTPRTLQYTYEGALCINVTMPGYFDVSVTPRASDATTIANTSTNLHLLTLSVTAPANPGMTNVIQTSVFVP